MTKHIRRRVLNYETRPNNSHDESSRKLFPLCYTAVLECGHRINQGVSDAQNKWKACWECSQKEKNV